MAQDRLGDLRQAAPLRRPQSDVVGHVRELVELTIEDRAAADEQRALVASAEAAWRGRPQESLPLHLRSRADLYLRPDHRMRDAGIGRVLVASLHQGIADILPTRLGFYENWLNAEGCAKARSVWRRCTPC